MKDRDVDLNTADFRKFTLVMPASWEQFSSQGFDSQVGGITNGKDTLRYDYGWYAYRFQQETTATHKRTNLVIASRPALLVVPKQPNKGLIGIYVQVDETNKFNLYGENIKDEAMAVRIMRSVKFK
ncbi:hypothetical protein [Hymenobacter roseosalivarius]|uniref:hypothetical protein n=1 Tax=Hymenobacter roseosalivarius TaxID=89967 RepID=UPI00117A4EBF|nr:hypothetical protein [Hymenobacter roseosalivarius]